MNVAQDIYIVSNYLLLDFYKNDLHTKDITVKVNDRSIKIDNSATFNIELFVFYLLSNTSLYLARNFVHCDNANDRKGCIDFYENKLFVDSIIISYKENNKQITKELNFEYYNYFRNRYELSKDNIKFIQFRNHDNKYCRYVYKLVETRDEIAIISRNTNESIDINTAKQIFEELYNIDNVFKIIDFPNYTIGLLFDVDEDDYVSVIYVK